MSSVSDPGRKSSEDEWLPSLNHRERLDAMRARIFRRQQSLPKSYRLPEPILDLIALESARADVTVRDVLSSGKTIAAVTRVRQRVIVELCGRHHSISQIARWLNIHHTSVRYLATTASERERSEAARLVQCREERRHQIAKLEKEPIDINAWDEWI